MREFARTWFSALRPKYWIISIFPLLIGASFSTDVSRFLPLAVAIIIWGPIFSGATYLANQYYDREHDKQNPRTRRLPLATGKITENTVKMSASLLFILGFLLSLTINSTFTGFYLTGVLLSITYSAPPVRLKEHAFTGLTVNGVGYGIIVLYAGWSLEHGISMHPLLLGIPLALAIGAGYVYKVVEDVWTDRKFDVQTIAVKFGWKSAVASSAILTILAYATISFFAAFGWINPLFGAVLPVGLIATLIFYRMLVPPTNYFEVKKNERQLSSCLLITLAMILLITLKSGI